MYNAYHTSCLKPNSVVSLLSPTFPTLWEHLLSLHLVGESVCVWFDKHKDQVLTVCVCMCVFTWDCNNIRYVGPEQCLVARSLSSLAPVVCVIHDPGYEGREMRSVLLSLFHPKYTLSQWSNVTDRVYVVFKEVNASIYHGKDVCESKRCGCECNREWHKTVGWVHWQTNNINPLLCKPCSVPDQQVGRCLQVYAIRPYQANRDILIHQRRLETTTWFNAEFQLVCDGMHGS